MSAAGSFACAPRCTRDRVSAWRRWRAAAVLCAGLALLGNAAAHKSSDAYLVWRIDGAQVEERIDIALRDLDRELDLDADDNQRLTWGEVRSRWPEIEQLADSAVQVSAGGEACSVVRRAAPQLDEHSDGRYAVLLRSLRCPAAVRRLDVDYRMFATSDATHRGIARIVAPGGERSAVLVPAAGAQEFAIEGGAGDSAASSIEAVVQRGFRSFAGFVFEGMHHIAIGADHVLFLVTLLMVAVWRRQGDGWMARDSAASAWRETFLLVSSFTLAHSLTLALAAFGVLAPPSRWVETIIAASVLIAAVDNLWPFLSVPRWTMVGVFGLAHGFGFAGPLQALGLQRGNLALPLLGFNLGVELGQLAIVALLLPLACALRAAPVYRFAVVRCGSLAIAAVAALWVVERGLDLNLMP